MERLRVFVYGTLKPGEANYARYCAGRVVEAVEAIAFGNLYALPLGYPAMTAGPRPVQGYLFTFAEEGILRDLDELEDYDPNRPPEECEYLREWTEVFDREGRSLGFAWVYRMSEAQVKLWDGVLLPDGNWQSSSPKQDH
ncbi:MAG TPA: gamma-glutamylcyclotransferase [Synechococcales cyanobacterium M55_K2018_004]|nr:gamma-glutamylcyclotransferase [Synechococcales cyanobacterium M55_K2018_004]